MTESDGITIDELRIQLDKAESKLKQYREAIELWDALNIKPGYYVDKAILIAKLINFEKSGMVVITASVTDGVDWVDEWGLVSSWQAISYSQKEYDTEGDDD